MIMVRHVNIIVNVLIMSAKLRNNIKERWGKVLPVDSAEKV